MSVSVTRSTMFFVVADDREPRAMRIVSPGGTTYRGNVINGTSGESTSGGSADTLNNVENVILGSPASASSSCTCL